jgi:hypothetical protein
MIKARTMRWGMGEKINAYKVFVGNPAGKRLLGRPRHKCVDRRII